MALADQPGYVIKMRAKKGMGDSLFELATEVPAEAKEWVRNWLTENFDVQL